MLRGWSRRPSSSTAGQTRMPSASSPSNRRCSPCAPPPANFVPRCIASTFLRLVAHTTCTPSSSAQARRTPGHRPLETYDRDALRALTPGLRKRHVNFLGRLIRFVRPEDRYEPASWPQRALADLIRAFDRAVLSTPLLEHLGGVAVFYGRTPAS